MKMLEVSSEFNLKLNSLDEQSIKMQIREELLDLRLNQEKKSNLKNYMLCAYSYMMLWKGKTLWRQ